MSDTTDRTTIMVHTNLLRPSLDGLNNAEQLSVSETDSRQLEQIGKQVAERYLGVNSFLIARSGQLVHESYYNGHTPGRLADLRSATKSFTSVLTGMAMQEYGINSVEERIERWLGDLFPPHPSSLLQETTIRHLLTMTTGFAWKTGKKLGEPDIHAFHRSRGWSRSALRRQIVPDMREVFQYRSIDTHLLSVLISRWSGQDAFTYANERLFVPLGIEQVAWSPSPEGHSIGHVGLCMTPRDMLKFGICCMQQGRWQGQSLIPAQWLEQSFLPHTDGYAGFGHYGYGWWNGVQDGVDYICAHGHGGQEIILLPKWDTVVVFTSESKVRKYKNPRHLLPELLFPLLDESSNPTN
ncbi:serine hydrolase domain-containing protein [Paenibacillus sp. WLX2291]|uniref:serine hydrolase domain-containing protein n=1 Tax=Paenibacillus sp. WLX2291 TaxID=3296934 RepID=UPI0039842934